jgi:hypothetical protein
VRAARGAAGATALIALACAFPGADLPGAAREAAPRVRIDSLASVDTYLLLERGAWSPTGARLALLEAFTGHSPTGLAVFDAARPGSAPRTLYHAGQWIRSYGWSPDGTWLLVLFGNASPENRNWLVALPADGAAPETLIAGSPVWPAAWGPDGRIHVRRDGRWRAMDPPARWKAAAAFTPRRVRAADPGAGTRLRIRDHASGSRSAPMLLGAYFASTGDVRVLDALPDGSRALVSVQDRMGGGGRVVDAGGRSLLDLRRAGIGFEPSALSSDGALIAGSSGGGGGGDQGWARTWLEVADGAGRWTAPVEGGDGGEAPQLSREGAFIAYRSGRGTRVGRLVVEPR